MNPEAFKNLNASQLEAVKHIDGAMLILAGAGSGKTKTLTTRLAYLIDEVGIPAGATLTLTFTNKAASEMRERAFKLIENNTNHPPLLCTFHRFGLLFLKFHIHHLGRENNFIVIDSDDKKKILKTFDKSLPVNTIESQISWMKNALISVEDAKSSAKDRHQRQIAQIYGDYVAFLEEKNMVDFDDLLALSYKILDANPPLAQEISNRYQYIMVDEYQDTNYLQYQLLQKLCTTHQNLCVVGDDDQSIYGWRGADISNILEFKDNFKDVKIIKLEENYRSSTQILNVANHLISHNTKRLGKELQSIKGDGKEITLYYSNDETEESNKISNKIKNLLQNGTNPNEIAILFRLNALSRSIEEGLNRAKIPYKLIGAMRFYERAEIKDILSYLRFIINPNDDFSLSRIINKPKRGIGKTTQEKIFQTAQALGISAYEAFKSDQLGSILSAKNHQTLGEFFATIHDLQDYLAISPLKFLEEFITSIDLIASVDNSNESIDRVSNIEEFYGMFRDYFIQSPMNSLQDFLNDLSLSTDADTSSDGVISCMSVHSAKGLEFKIVFITGFEEGFFPLIRDQSDIEEERRLGYVAFTRAKDELYISYVRSRFYKGKRTELEKSRFLQEAKLLTNKKETSGGLDFKNKDFKKGDLVTHKIFGTGRIEGIEGSGQNAKLTINFGGLQRDILASFVQKTDG
ncbi:UvrD-helicase domain-containing protein [Helicobacter sp. 11S02596-1]|uniref:UvrD-helicase domain-containing protein n=1 Tax=Helicobacter sp. 11S02596-1 TaxID=1476194 RepID=UPI000BA5DDD4|nr:UvrD-helicase domain-containing protein [Helicobacter sp. 11S02596-1]PAF42470.1 ATP-dependent DNA helicase [Helicobacter sp. 11S02596-1]